MAHQPTDPEESRPPPDYTEPPGRMEPPATTEPAEREPEDHRLRRSRDERMIAGVAGGMAEYFDVDPVLIRIAFVLLTIFGGGIGIPIYIVAWIVMPEERPGEAGRAARRRGRRDSRSGSLVLGLILLVAGLLALAWTLDLPTIPWGTVLAIALVAVGVGLIALARDGLNGGLVFLGIVLTVILAAGNASDVDLDFEDARAFGEEVVVVDDISELDREYGYWFGSFTLNLRDLEVPEGTTTVAVRIGFGDADVILPEDVPVLIVVDTVFGDTEALGRQWSGIAADGTIRTEGYDEAERRIAIDASTLFGSMRIAQ